MQERLFEPFFTTKPEGKGTGLGLATVPGIVNECGGRISVDSAPGQGSTFTIVLPATSAHVTERAIDRTVTSAGPSRVLLVEDDEAVRELSQSILERAGYVVSTAASVAEAIAVLDREPIGLVSDVVIVGGTGSDIFRQAARTDPIFACSSSPATRSTPSTRRAWHARRVSPQAVHRGVAAAAPEVAAGSI